MLLLVARRRWPTKKQKDRLTAEVEKIRLEGAKEAEELEERNLKGDNFDEAAGAFDPSKYEKYDKEGLSDDDPQSKLSKGFDPNAEDKFDDEGELEADNKEVELPKMDDDLIKSFQSKRFDKLRTQKIKFRRNRGFYENDSNWEVEGGWPYKGYITDRVNGTRKNGTHSTKDYRGWGWPSDFSDESVDECGNRDIIRDHAHYKPVGTLKGADIHGREVKEGKFMTDAAILGVLYRKPYYEPTDRWNMDPYKWNKTWMDMLPLVWNGEKNRYSVLRIDPGGAENNAADNIKPYASKHERVGEYVRIIGKTVHYSSDQIVMWCKYWDQDDAEQRNLRTEEMFTGCGIIVCSDALGISDNLLQFCDVMAKEGMVVMMPDMSHNVTFVDEGDYPPSPSQLNCLRKHAEGLTWGDVKPDMDFAVSFLDMYRHCRQFAVVGVGIGCSVAARLCCEPQFKALTLINPTHMTEEIAREVKCPTMLIDGGFDHGGEYGDGSWGKGNISEALRNSPGGRKGYRHHRFSDVSSKFLTGLADWSASNVDQRQAAAEATELVVHWKRHHMLKPPKEFEFIHNRQTQNGTIEPLGPNATEAFGYTGFR